MRYFSIDVALFSTPDFIRATAKQKGVWLELYSYCASQENNGIIIQGANWSDSHWLRLGLCRADLDEDSPLWFFRSENLFLNHYDVKLEEYVRGNRKSGGIGGSKRTPKKIIAARKNGAKGGRPKIIPMEQSGQ